MSDQYANDPAARLKPGTRLNDVFEIERHVASGGVGDVYRGHVVETGDAVAIKVLRTDLVDNETALALFRKEASALHHIHHEAIVRYYVFSFDPAIRRHYLAMEFVDGEPLSDVLKRGPLAVDEVVWLQQRLAAGLHAAHLHGIIHRDVSPDNVVIPDGDVRRAKIIDFGIARSTRANSRTIIGSGFAGKYNYVSPEQLGLHGGDVTAKSDIYSLGIVLAQCLTGRQMDMGGTTFEVIEKRRVVPDLGAVDAGYRPLLVHMLQPDPRDRPESLADVALWRPQGPAGVADRQVRGVSPPASQQTAQGTAQSIARVPWKKKTAARERRELTFLVLVALLSCAGIAFYLTRDRAPTPGPPVAPSASDAREADRQRVEREAALKRETDERTRREEAAAEAERQRLEHEAALKRDADERTRQEAAAAEAEHQRVEREAALKREADERTRQEGTAAAVAEAERQRVEREAALKREAEEWARQQAVIAAAAEAERQRVEGEAALKREADERTRQEAAAAAAEAERQRVEREAALKREVEERARQEAAAAATEAERQRVEREAALKREAEEWARQQAVAAAAAEADRQRVEREAALKREAEEGTRQQAAAAEADRRRVEHEAALKREADERARQEVAAAAAAEAERQRVEREAALKREADERTRQEAAAAEAKRQQAERETRIARFIKTYEGGDCFFVSPTAVAADHTTLDGFGSSVAPFEALDADFKRANGFEALIGVHQVTRSQCPAVTFLAQVRNQPGVAPRLDIDAASLKSGSDLAGSVADFGDRNVHLLLVADDGAVYDLSGKLKSAGAAKSFTLGLRSPDAGPAQPQLLVAVVSNTPLDAFRMTRPGNAGEVFARALQEARDTGQPLNVSARYFKLEK